MTSCVAVFDIGKTNKKFLLFDESYRVVYEVSETFPEIEDDDGFPCDNLSAFTEWMQHTLNNALHTLRFKIKAVNFSAYGASLVHLDEQGRPLTPLYNYLKPIPEEITHSFYSQYGSLDEMALQTASPAMGMLNSGLQLYWLKKAKPEVFSRIKQSLHLPQYLSYLFTGKAFSEITSIGCHTALWNFSQNAYHAWVAAEDMVRLLPPIRRADEVTKSLWGVHEMQFGVGLHDSSAALLPFLQNESKPFGLLSTGTWSVAFNPFNQSPLTVDDLRKDCLAYLGIEGQSVKAARLFLGNEHQQQEKKLAEFFHKSAAYCRTVRFDPSLVGQLQANRDPAQKFYPETLNMAGYHLPVPHGVTDLSRFESYEEAYHRLNIDLVSWQTVALKTALGKTDVDKMFVSGGFCDSPIFIRLLAEQFPEAEWFTASMPHASALGAAMIMRKQQSSFPWQDFVERVNLEAGLSFLPDDF